MAFDTSTNSSAAKPHPLEQDDPARKSPTSSAHDSHGPGSAKTDKASEDHPQALGSVVLHSTKLGPKVDPTLSPLSHYADAEFKSSLAGLTSKAQTDVFPQINSLQVSHKGTDLTVTCGMDATILPHEHGKQAAAGTQIVKASGEAAEAVEPGISEQSKKTEVNALRPEAVKEAAHILAGHFKTTLKGG